MIRRWGPRIGGVIILLGVMLFLLAKLSPSGGSLYELIRGEFDVFPLIAQRACRTLTRWLIAFAIGISTGMLLGWVLGLGRLSRVLIQPSYDFLRFIPVVLMIPIIRKVGLTGEWMYYVLTGWTGTWITALQIARGVRSASRDQIERVTCLNWGRLKRARHIYLRWVSEYLAGSIEQTGTACFLVLIAVEMLGPVVSGREGLGTSISDGVVAARADLQLLHLVAAGCIGITVGYGCRGVARFLPRAIPEVR